MNTSSPYRGGARRRVDQQRSASTQRRIAATPRGVGIGFPTVYAERALNAELWDVEGRRYIDFGSGIAVLNTGHRHPRVVAGDRSSSWSISRTPPTRSCRTKASSRWPSG